MSGEGPGAPERKKLPRNAFKSFRDIYDYYADTLQPDLLTKALIQEIRSGSITNEAPLPETLSSLGEAIGYEVEMRLARVTPRQRRQDAGVQGLESFKKLAEGLVALKGENGSEEHIIGKLREMQETFVREAAQLPGGKPTIPPEDTNL